VSILIPRSSLVKTHIEFFSVTVLKEFKTILIQISLYLNRIYDTAVELAFSPKGWWDKYESHFFKTSTKLTQQQQRSVNLFKILSDPTRDLLYNIKRIQRVGYQLKFGRVDFRPDSEFSLDCNHNGDYDVIVGRVNEWARSEYGTSLIYGVIGDPLSKVVPTSSDVVKRGVRFTCSDIFNKSVWDSLQPFFTVLDGFLVEQDNSWALRRDLPNNPDGMGDFSEERSWTSTPDLSYGDCYPSDNGMRALVKVLRQKSITHQQF